MDEINTKIVPEIVASLLACLQIEASAGYVDHDTSGIQNNGKKLLQ